MTTMTTMRTALEHLQTCPACGQDHALLALGVRYEHPHRWRPWVTRRAALYLCHQCDALVAVDRTRRPVVESLPGGAPCGGDAARPREPRGPWPLTREALTTAALVVA